MSFYRSIVCFLLFGLFSSTAIAQKTDYKADIAALEQRRVAAQIQQNIPALAACLDESMQYIHSNGMVENKQEHLDAIQQKKYEISVYEITPKTYLKHKKMCVVYGDAHVEVLYKGTDVVFNSRFTAVYIKRKRQWRLASWQNTKY